MARRANDPQPRNTGDRARSPTNQQQPTKNLSRPELPGNGVVFLSKRFRSASCVTFAGIGRPVIAHQSFFACQTICLDRLTGHHATSMQLALRQLGHTAQGLAGPLPAKRETTKHAVRQTQHQSVAPRESARLDRPRDGRPHGGLSGASRPKPRPPAASLRPTLRSAPRKNRRARFWFTCLP